MLGCWWRAYKLAQLRRLRANTAMMLELWDLHDEVSYSMKSSILKVIRCCEKRCGLAATMRARYFRYVEGKRALEEVASHTHV